MILIIRRLFCFLDVSFTMAADALVPMGNINATIDFGDNTVTTIDLTTLITPGGAAHVVVSG